MTQQWPGIPSNVNDYENPWSTPIIMNGKIYYNTPPVSDVANMGTTAWICTLEKHYGTRTALTTVLNQVFVRHRLHSWSKLYWADPRWLYHYDSVNGKGILSYLIMVSGTTWYFLDATTGNFMLKLINVPGGTAATDQDGSLLRYSYNSTTGNLLCWNSSQSIPPLGPVGTNQQQWKMPLGRTIDAVNDTTWTQVGPATMTATAPISVPAEAIQPRSGYTMNVTVERTYQEALKSYKMKTECQNKYLVEA